jgi:cytochrome c oxidase subunit 2
LRSHDDGRINSGRRRRAAVLALALPAVLFLSGCSKEAELGFLPVDQKDQTNQTARIIDLWNGSWIAALTVGALVWGLMIWCMIVYRRRKDATGLPAQVRYNIPLEILYTVVPIMAIGGLFWMTADAQAKIIDTSAKPDLTINVVAKQWAWDFNYIDSNVYDTGVQAQLTGKSGVEETLPALYVPVNKRVEFIITSRDVIHSFWVPSFLFKLDAIPGVENKYQVIPQREGTFQGKCSELCGEYHSEMLFNVKVVSQAEYDAHMAELKAKGQTGKLDTNLGRSKTRPGGGAVPGNPVTETEGTK